MIGCLLRLALAPTGLPALFDELCASADALTDEDFELEGKYR